MANKHVALFLVCIAIVAALHVQDAEAHPRGKGLKYTDCLKECIAKAHGHKLCEMKCDTDRTTKEADGMFIKIHSLVISDLLFTFTIIHNLFVFLCGQTGRVIDWAMRINLFKDKERQPWHTIKMWRSFILPHILNVLIWKILIKCLTLSISCNIYNL